MWTATYEVLNSMFYNLISQLMGFTSFSRAVQAERLIWSLWCLYVCMYVCRDVVLLDNCLTEKSITLLDNCLTEKSITYSHTQRNFF